MPAERVSMRRVREILRLKYEAGASDRAIARSVGVARSTARLCLDRVVAAGLTWPLPEELTDGALAREFLRRVTLPLVAVSLGGVESIMSYPVTMSHSMMSEEERLRRGITDSLIRFSVGLEAPEDLLADITAALAACRP